MVSAVVFVIEGFDNGFAAVSLTYDIDVTIVTAVKIDIRSRTDAQVSTITVCENRSVVISTAYEYLINIIGISYCDRDIRIVINIVNIKVRLHGFARVTDVQYEGGDHGSKYDSYCYHKYDTYDR